MYSECKQSAGIEESDASNFMVQLLFPANDTTHCTLDNSIDVVLDRKVIGRFSSDSWDGTFTLPGDREQTVNSCGLDIDEPRDF